MNAKLIRWFNPAFQPCARPVTCINSKHPGHVRAEQSSSLIPFRCRERTVLFQDIFPAVNGPLQVVNEALKVINATEQVGEALARAPLLGQSTVAVRACGGQPARTAIVELRSRRVDLDGSWRPGGRQPPLRDVGVMEVREVQVPEGVKEPLHWKLLTSLPCATPAQAQRVVGRYAARWWIEEYHKALKSGAGVEESQLERAGRLEPLIGVLAVVAVRLLSAKMLARSRPAAFEAAAGFGPEMLTILAKKIGPPKGGWNNQNVIIATARLGGFLARKQDGLPGWQTIWRGWQRLMWMCEGLKTLQLK